MLRWAIVEDGADAGPPPWATEAVRIVAYDPAWPGLGTRFAREVADLFAGRLVSDVVHVGSTSVPGLAAKPVVDLQAVCADPAAATLEVRDDAAAAGWRFVPRELDARPWRWLFVRVDADERSRLAHLHLMAPGTQRWDHQLLFRDRLRASRPLREEYARLKARSAAEHGDDREAYGAAKTAFVRRVVGASWPTAGNDGP